MRTHTLKQGRRCKRWKTPSSACL